MTIHEVLIGTWFPRTGLHLQEIEAVLRGQRLPHHPPEVLSLLKALAVTHVGTRGRVFRTLSASSPGLTMSITEDGIVVLRTLDDRLTAARQQLTKYYEGRLSPLLESIFRRGMPLPKELANIRGVIPFFAVAYGGTTSEAAALARRHGGASAFSGSLGPLTVFPGSSVTVLHLPSSRSEQSLPLSLEELIQYMIFIREFETQLHTYLQLHRDIWESIDAVVETKRLRYRDLTNIRNRLTAQRKTIGFVRARIAQMGDVLNARMSHIHEQNLEAYLSRLGLARFTSLASAQQYLAHLWEVTDRYAESTEGLVRLIHDENLRREVVVLNIIVFGTLLTGYFGMNVPLPWEDRWSAQWPSTLLVSVLLFVFAVGGYFFLRNLVLNRYFTLRNPDGGARGSRTAGRRLRVLESQG